MEQKNWGVLIPSVTQAQYPHPVADTEEVQGARAPQTSIKLSSAEAKIFIGQGWHFDSDNGN